MTRPWLVVLLGFAVLAALFVAVPYSSRDRDEPTAVDVGFLQDMIAHHHQAVTMAEIMRGGADAEITGLADVLRVNQFQEIGQMTGFLQAWGSPIVSPGQPMRWMLDQGHAHQPGTGEMPGMATRDDLNRLGKVDGVIKDILFLELMMQHHAGGVHMAESAANLAATPQVRALAQQMAVGQTEEIHRMAVFLKLRDPQALPPGS
jgi:uncharacterized protein (DUF305 family)